MCHRSINQHFHFLDCFRRLKGLPEVNIIVIESKDKSDIHQSSPCMSLSHHFISTLSDWWGGTRTNDTIFSAKIVNVFPEQKHVCNKLRLVCASYSWCVFLHTYLLVGQTQKARTIKLPVDSLPNYLDSQWTAPISSGKISVFSFWPSQQSCLRCRSTSSLFSLTKLAKALPVWEGRSADGVQGSWVKEKDWWWSKWRDREMLTTRLALCVCVWERIAGVLLMSFGQFSWFKAVL